MSFRRYGLSEPAYLDGVDNGNNNSMHTSSSSSPESSNNSSSTDSSSSRPTLLFANFSPFSHKLRPLALRAYTRLATVTSKNSSDLAGYFGEMGRSKFVLSPPGEIVETMKNKFTIRFQIAALFQVALVVLSLR